MPGRAKIALIGAGASAALLILTWLVAFHTGFGKHADQSVFLGFVQLGRPRVNSVASLIAHVCDPVPFALLAAVALAVAFARGRARLALATGAILVGANVSTHLLKPLLAAPRAHELIGPLWPVGPASWPSGHATAAMSLALAFVLAAPAPRRPVVAALGAVFAVAVSYSFLTLGWHYPSDVLGGFLVALLWTQLAVAGLLTFDARRGRASITADRQPVSLRSALGPPAAALSGAIALVGLIALARPHQVIAYAHLHKAFMVGATAIGALGLALSTAVMLNVRR